MNAETLITPSVREHIEDAIRMAEAGTSCEIRVHVEDECNEQALDRAAFIFAKFEMHKTKARNGVLIYAALKHRKTAILGDVGINSVVPSGFWDETLSEMIAYFREQKVEDGLLHSIRRVGEKIRGHFPVQHDDKDELSNSMTFGDPVAPNDPQ